MEDKDVRQLKAQQCVRPSSGIEDSMKEIKKSWCHYGFVDNSSTDGQSHWKESI